MLADASRAGARILVILNTVGRAIALQRAIEASGLVEHTALFKHAGIVALHHGRYAPADREGLDASVSARFGKGSAGGPVLLVGTQTLEQSLDIDADYLVTDLCPMDVLLQRIGRLHRHDERTRAAGFQAARCVVMVPPEPDFSVFLGERGEATRNAKSNGLGSVYEDLRMLQLTRDLLSRAPVLELPRDNRRLVELSTHPDALSRLAGERWDRHGRNVEGTDIARGVAADGVLLTRLYDHSFGDFAFNEVSDGEARTRLGLDTLSLPLDHEVRGPFGVLLSGMVIPGHMAPRDVKDEWIKVASAGAEGLEMEYGGKRYRYTRFGLEVGDEPSG